MEKKSEPHETWLCHGCGTTYWGDKIPKYCPACEEDINERILLVKVGEK